MKTIERIIRISGGLEALEEHTLHVYKPPFLPLQIRALGIGPRDLDYLVVSQMIPLPGVEKLESEICFEIGFPDDGSWGWYPVSYRQRSPAFYHTCAWVEPDGSRGFNLQTEEGLKVIASAWDEILVARGYMELGPVL